MADSNITKRALAASLKSLMSQQPFSKISIGDICDKCEMNRKSFYYHFHDKYELVNWIFEREFVTVSKSKSYPNLWDAFYDLCKHLYDNKEFYRCAFLIDGQNSFRDYFISVCKAMFTQKLYRTTNDSEIAEFQADFLAEGLKSALQNWLTEKECISAEDFSQKVKVSVCNIATLINHDNK